jgi:hypothetical protein
MMTGHADNQEFGAAAAMPLVNQELSNTPLGQ